MSNALLGLTLGALLLVGACTSPDSADAPDTPPADTTVAPDPGTSPAPEPQVITPGDETAARPVAPLRIVGACPFECCTYATWTTSAETRVYRTAGDTTAIAFTVPAETALEAETGHVLLTTLGLAVADTPVELYAGPDEKRMAAPGDTLLLLDHLGEGFIRAWYDGGLYDVSSLPNPDMSNGLTWLREPAAQWWARVRTADGRTGWLWMDRTPPVRGADACG